MLKPLSPSDSFRYDIRLYKTLDAFRALQPQWRVLSAAANAHCPFINFEYCELAVEQALASGAAIEVATVFGAQELLVLWPVAIVNKGMLRTAQSPGCGCGEEYGGPLIRDVRRDDLYHAAVHAIMRIHADVLVIPMLENGSALQRALDVAPRSWVLARLPPRWRAMPGYSIGLRAYPAWNDFLSTRHSTLRASLRSSLKRLRRQGDVSFGWCSSAHEAETVLRWLFENKRRWALARGIESSYLMDSRVCEFFITLARRIDPSSAPLVAFVKVNGQPVCASVNLVGARVVEYFITTYDETFRMFSVGNLLVEFIAEWAHANGRNFDFRPLHGDYKARWADRHSWYATRMVVLNPLGRLAELSLLWEQGGRAYRKMASVVARRLT